MNRLDRSKRIQILSALVEGNSIRSTVRMTGVSKNTISKLLLEVGTACAQYQDKAFQNLHLKRIQVDEIWSFVGAKDKNLKDDESAALFVEDLASRLACRIQLTSGGHKPYLEAVEGAFGSNIDYAMLIKMYGADFRRNRATAPHSASGRARSKSAAIRTRSTSARRTLSGRT